MTEKKFDFSREKSIIVLVVISIIWSVIFATIMLTVDLDRYDEQSSMSMDRLSGDFKGVHVPETENQTLENLSFPMLFIDNSTMVMTLPEGKYSWHGVVESSYNWLRITNESGWNLGGGGGRSSSSSIGISDGGTKIKEEEELRKFEFSGDHILMFYNASITFNLTNEQHHSGKTSSRITTFRFHPTEQQDSFLDHTILSIDMDDTLFNFTVYDQYYNILAHGGNVTGSITIDFNGMGNEYNYVVIEADDDQSDIEISLDSKRIASKNDDYSKIVIVVAITGMLGFGVTGFLLGNVKEQSP
jgi:hypothetical protein